MSQDKKVLFLGNSYTAVNNLPNLLTELALSAGYELYTQRSTPGGYTLGFPEYGHLYNPTSINLINSEEWDYVVLQEQSQYPVIEFYRDNYTYPGAIGLDSLIHLNDNCTQTMFFMTWGRKNGGQQCIGSYCSINFVDYAHMQDSLASTYVNLSNMLDCPVAPVGIAWRNSIVNNGDPIDLFSADGSHPSLAGSYLAACVFYASIFHSSPQGLNYTAGIDENTAAYLQTIAHNTVFDNLNSWNIDTTTVSSDFNFSQNYDTVFFINQSRNCDEFLWDFGNGKTDTIENPICIYNESGNYNVQLIASSGCKSDTIVKEVSVVISDFCNRPSNSIINCFPNPNNGFFNYHNVDLSGKAKVTISDLNGGIIYTEDRVLIPNSDIEFNYLLKPGIYNICIKTTTKEVSSKIVITP